MPACRSTAIVIAFAMALATPMAALAEADEGAYAWKAEWHRPTWVSGAVAGAFFAAGLGIQYGIGPADEPRWTSPILVDEPVQARLRADSNAALRRTRTASDVLVAAMVATPLVLEPALALGHGDADSAMRLALMNAQTLSVTVLSTVALKHAIGRQRPAGSGCAEGSDADPGCDERDTLGFPSGHASSAFAGAGMICLNHEMFRPLGGGWDRAACGLALGAAAGASALRIAANRHYVSDVFAGAAIGLSTGYLLPKWLYVGFGAKAPLLGDAAVTIAPQVGEMSGVRVSLAW